MSLDEIPAERLRVMVERAVYLIENEWGYSRERALDWLQDDEYAWSEEENERQWAEALGRPHPA